MIGFERKRGFDDFMNTSLIGIQGELDPKQTERLRKIKQAWNFYEGYHWEELPEQDTPELTMNYCRAFVDKFVAFELGKGFTFTTHKDMEGVKVTKDGRTLFEYLEDVWEDNNQCMFCTEMGQQKSITGEAWVQVRYFDKDEIDDPFGEYPDGRMRLLLLPTSTVFPEYDPHQRDVIVRVTIMYTYEKIVKTPVLGKIRKEKTLFKQVWTKDECITYDGKAEPVVVTNKYKTIPFVLIKNLPLSGRTDCRGDLDDLIPLNTEYNLKQSDISAIIDYHAAPVTIVYGAKIGNLEKGANKVWGGLPKDAKVENLGLQGDLTASANYIAETKTAMCEIAGIPETVLGGASAISNTSGVALQYINLPLIERTRIKRNCSTAGLETVNEYILFIAMYHGLIEKPEDISMKDFVSNEVTLPDTLPKDELMELQKIQQEMTLGIECRHGAMERTGKTDIDRKLKEIDAERQEHPELFNPMLQQTWYQNQQSATNAGGMMNGQTPVETVRKEMMGQNGVQTPQ